jgi:hypothetical protein
MSKSIKILVDDIIKEYGLEALGTAGGGIGGGNFPKTDNETIEMLIAAELLPAVTTVLGAILTDENGNVILRY